MTVSNRVPVLNRVDGYEQASFVGIILTIVGSIMAWLTVEADAEAAAELDNIDQGTTTLSGQYLGFGDITIILGIVAAVVLVLVLWRYGAAGRKTGLLIMLIGLITAGVAVVGIVLTGMIYAPADDFAGVSVDLGIGIFVTLLGAIILLSGGVLRLAAGSPSK
jgi:hypothetical protein